LTEAIIIFILLYAAAGAINRFIAHWLMTSTQLTYSDRTLLQRVINATTVAVVILISLRAAGIHSKADEPDYFMKELVETLRNNK
jgi:small-conductance mechanosensitive channel